MIDNIFWVSRLNIIGGVETFMFELAKMFQDYDFVIYYNNIPPNQLKRLKKYVRCVKYKPGEKLKCKKFFCNYDNSIIEDVEAEEYIQIIHCVFKYNPNPPHTHKKITKYYAVSKEASDSFKDLTGKECEVIHNPLQLEPVKRILKLISATRLDDDKGKILERTKKLANKLEENKMDYIWLIFTSSEDTLKNPNIIYMPPNLDIRNYIAASDYLIQLSDTEAFCYSVLESLYLNIPVIVTPIPCFSEMGVENGKTGYILDFDMNDIPIFDIYNKIPRFDFHPLKNEWENMIIKNKSSYKEELKMKYLVEATDKYEELNCSDNDLKRIPKAGEQWEVTKERLDVLLGENSHNAVFVKMIKPIKEEPEEAVVQTADKEKAVKKKSK